MLKIFTEYSEQTSIHGIQYIGEKQSNKFEKCFWVIILVLSCCWCLILIAQIWTKWDAHPITVTFDDTMKDITDLWFPAITICPITKLNDEDDNLYNKLIEYDQNKIMNMSYKEIEDLTALLYICDDDLGLLNSKYSDIVKTLNKNHSGFDLKKSIKKMYDKLTLTPFFRKTNNEEAFLQFILTMNDEGICYSYNINNGTQMFRETANITFSYVSSLSVLPESLTKVSGNGHLNGITAFFRDEKMTVDAICNGLDHGYKVYLHNSNEFPSSRLHSYYLPFNTRADIVIKPSIFVISDDAEKLPVNIRQCYMDDERELKYFLSYNKVNCEIECIANLTMQHCNCTPFYLPNEEFYNECLANDIDCVDKIWNLSNDSCHCLPNCNNIQYDADLYTHQMDINNMLTTLEMVADKSDGEIASELALNKFSIYFKHLKVLPMKRIAFYGWSDFIANCGGLMGLFMGVSIVSFVEIFYFLIIRRVCDKKSNLNDDKNN